MTVHSSAGGDILSCMDCGKPYRDFPLDTNLPNAQWKMIHNSDGGVLCANCMVERISRLPKAVAVQARIDFAEPSLQSANGDLAALVERLHKCASAPIGKYREWPEPLMHEAAYAIIALRQEHTTIERNRLSPMYMHQVERAEAAERDAARLSTLAGLMVDGETDVTICPPGNHGGDADKWLVTVERNRDTGPVREAFGATLGEAIDEALRK